MDHRLELVNAEECNLMKKPENKHHASSSSKVLLLSIYKLVFPRSTVKPKGDCAFKVVACKLLNGQKLHLRSVDTF